MAFPIVKFAPAGGIEGYIKETKALLVFENVGTGRSVSFLAFLTDFAQSFASNWTTENVFGRADPIPTFQGTKRTISLSWDIPSYNLQDAKNNLKRSSELIRSLYPSY